MFFCVLHQRSTGSPVKSPFFTLSPYMFLVLLGPGRRKAVYRLVFPSPHFSYSHVPSLHQMHDGTQEPAGPDGSAPPRVSRAVQIEGPAGPGDGGIEDTQLSSQAVAVLPQLPRYRPVADVHHEDHRPPQPLGLAWMGAKVRPRSRRRPGLWASKPVVQRSRNRTRCIRGVSPRRRGVATASRRSFVGLGVLHQRESGWLHPPDPGQGQENQVQGAAPRVPQFAVQVFPDPDEPRESMVAGIPLANCSRCRLAASIKSPPQSRAR